MSAFSRFVGLFAVLPAATAGVGCTQAPEPIAVSEWDHGFKTDYVVATRYTSPHFGLNIGFRFPKHFNTYDSPEVFDWFRNHDGTVIQGGGYPGAEVLVIFKGVTDKQSANKRLAVLMPELTAFMKARK